MKYISLRYSLIVIVLLFATSIKQSHAATTISLYVGHSQIVSAPNPPQGALYAVAWASHHSSVSVSNYGTYGGQVTINSYFTGTAQIQCDYYWHWYVGTRMYTNHATTYYNVTCKAVTLSVNPKSVSLSPGQGTTISYSLSPSISPTPTVRFYSNNTNVATVNNNGYVYAVGSGSTTITVENSAGPSATCSVQVRDIAVTSASVSSPMYIDADEQKTLSATTYPSNATVRSKTWYIEDGAEYISLTSSGTLTGKNPGTAKIYCIVNGNVQSNVATVYVSEPSFTTKSTSPSNNATGVSAFITPSVTYSLALYQGENYSNISLKKNLTGSAVVGTANISGKVIIFKPSKPLEEQTNYTLTIPANALKNKWGTSYAQNVIVNFTTGSYEQLTLSASQASGFVAKGVTTTLTANKSNVSIYYTTDGSIPTPQSTLYTGTITIDKDMHLRAIAMGEGYKNSEILERDYIISNVEVVRKFPIDEEPLYIYRDVNPFVAFSNRMEASVNIDEVCLFRNGTEAVAGEVFVNDSVLFFVPDEPLKLGTSYTMNIPVDALKTWQGESCKATSWTFSTGNFAMAVSTGGPELGAAIKTDGSLWTWGKLITEANDEDGSYSYKVQEEPAEFVVDDVLAVSSGYMHHAFIKRDGSLWMWGRQYCGEFGNASTIASTQPLKVMDGVKSVSCGMQTTAIVKTDGTLWMCGRNDMGQIDDSRTVHTSYMKVADGVSKATLHWGSIDIIKTDGSTEVRTWDANADEGRMPAEAGLADAAQMEYGWQNAVALGQDGSVWTWGQDHSLSEVIAGRNPQPLEGIRLLMPSMHLEVGERTIIAQRPVPLLADYSELTWHTSNADIATINSRGLVEALSDGYTTVTATISNAQGQCYEAQCNITVGNANTIQTLSLAKGWNWISTYLQEPQPVSGLADGSSRIVSQEQELIRDPQFGMVGSLTAMEPGKAYKVEADNTYNCMFGGSLYDSLSPITLKKGWNWIGYPMAHTMAPSEALAIAESEEGELLIGQDGMAVYSDGQWTGTLTEMVPGQGFMYRSASDKNLFYNAMAQASSRRSKAQYSSYNLQSAIPDDWRVDKHRYPNVMGVIAQLWIDQTLADAGDWILGAFSADECRGIAMAIDGNGTSEAVLMMNVYGSGGEPITFCVVNRETGEVLQAIEQEPFRADVVGTMSQPYALHIGTVTGVQTAAADARHAAVYDLQGRRVDGVQAGKGIYVVSGGKRSRAQKIVKK